MGASTSSKVLWDDVPAEVKADLARRTDVKPNGIAIVEHSMREQSAAGEHVDRHERWYFRKGPYGWLNLSVDRDAAAPETAPDLTPEQRASALRQVAKVEEAMKEKLPDELKGLPEAVAIGALHELTGRMLKDAVDNLKNKYAAGGTVTGKFTGPGFGSFKVGDVVIFDNAWRRSQVGSITSVDITPYGSATVEINCGSMALRMPYSCILRHACPANSDGEHDRIDNVLGQRCACGDWAVVADSAFPHVPRS